jgi:hypothetical protein
MRWKLDWGHMLSLHFTLEYSDVRPVHHLAPYCINITQSILPHWVGTSHPLLYCIDTMHHILPELTDVALDVKDLLSHATPVHTDVALH